MNESLKYELAAILSKAGLGAFSAELDVRSESGERITITISTIEELNDGVYKSNAHIDSYHDVRAM